MTVANERRYLPGPWGWEFHPDTHEPIALAARDGDVLLATGDGSRSWAIIDEDHRNLLAAVPDLMEALRCLVAAAEQWDAGGTIGLSLAHGLSVAREAIARANGKGGAS